MRRRLEPDQGRLTVVRVSPAFIARIGSMGHEKVSGRLATSTKRAVSNWCRRSHSFFTSAGAGRCLFAIDSRRGARSSYARLAAVLTLVSGTLVRSNRLHVTHSDTFRIGELVRQSGDAWASMVTMVARTTALGKGGNGLSSEKPHIGHDRTPAAPDFSGVGIEPIGWRYRSFCYGDREGIFVAEVSQLELSVFTTMLPT